MNAPLDYAKPRLADDPSDSVIHVSQRIRQILGFTAIAAFIFVSTYGSVGGFRQQVAAFVVVGCLASYVVAVLVNWAMRVVTNVRKRRRTG